MKENWNTCSKGAEDFKYRSTQHYKGNRIVKKKAVRQKLGCEWCRHNMMKICAYQLGIYDFFTSSHNGKKFKKTFIGRILKLFVRTIFLYNNRKI